MNCEFTAEKDQIKFTTQTNGDRVDIKMVHLDSDAAANLAQMINSGNQLKIEIKEA